MPVLPRPLGWAPGTHSLVVLFDGHHRDLISDKDADRALDHTGNGKLDFRLGSPHDTVLERFRDDGFGILLELTSSEQTRLQAVHVAPDDPDTIARLSSILRKLLEQKLPRPTVTGMNFARVYLDGPHFSSKPFLQQLGHQSGLYEILGGSGVHGLSEATVIRDVKNERAGQLKLRSIRGEAITGPFTGLHADVNFTSPTPTKAKIRSATTRKALLNRYKDFGRIMSRLEQRMSHDD